MKATQSIINDRIATAYTSKTQIAVSFDTLFTPEFATAALREAIENVPVNKLENEFLRLLELGRERSYKGIIVEMNSYGLCKIELNNGEYKSFYLNNVKSVTSASFHYTK